MENKIIILTGKIKTGKTTSLFTFINRIKSADGILQPVVNNRRRLYHISSKTIHEFETDNPSGDTISIGKYNFLKRSFEWANEKILDGLNQKPEWMVIDEIGKLELMGEGLDKSIIDALKISAKLNTKLILVVRDYLLEKVISRYGLNDDEYLIVTDLNKI